MKTDILLCQCQNIHIFYLLLHKLARMWLAVHNKRIVCHNQHYIQSGAKKVDHHAVCQVLGYQVSVILATYVTAFLRH